MISTRRHAQPLEAGEAEPVLRREPLKLNFDPRAKEVVARSTAGCSVSRGTSPAQPKQSKTVPIRAECSNFLTDLDSGVKVKHRGGALNGRATFVPSS